MRIEWTLVGPNRPVLADPTRCEAADPARTDFACRFVDQTPPAQLLLSRAR